MAILMYVQQKMTPTVATDPSQQRMMALMPLFIGAMFIVYPFSSGLALYILTTNLIGIAQRMHLNRVSPLKPAGKRAEK
jgi:YidC/Oxa1 family membrane protein insertase